MNGTAAPKRHIDSIMHCTALAEPTYALLAKKGSNGSQLVPAPARMPAEPTDAELSMTTADAQRLSFVEYLQLLDWTGRQVREDKTGVISGSLTPILERLALSSESWLLLVHDFRRKFRRAAGTPESLSKEYRHLTIWQAPAGR